FPGPFGSPADEPVLVPVTELDHSSRRRRLKMLVAAAAICVAVTAAWLYKRTVDPVRALDEYDAGERALRLAHYQEAIVSLDRAISLKADFADAYALRGRANIAISKPAAAIPDFDKVLALRPRDPIAYVDRGSAFLAEEEPKKAVADFSRAIELDPKLARAYNLRGIALRGIGQTKEALADLTKAVEINPSMDNLFQRGATYQALNDHEFAILDFTRVIGLDPNSAQGFYARSKSFRAMGNNEAADRDHLQGRINDAR
ncbi:MAG: hypothetical protein RL328_2025, partial [Acidobacteriota bacterium]